ncbi:MAG: cyclic nucleotide-binding domain-containing protein [Deltaproteobacteria bacterium]|nr:cyclic nucleotide-binding domain-containing protein [Deltaproteobacteria bacterium]
MATEQHTDGLAGEWLSRDALAQIDFFKGSKRPFTIKLNSNLGVVPEQTEPGIKAVVKRHYQKGDVICKAGDFGSTAFLLLEGSAVASLPSQMLPAVIAGRSARTGAWLRGLFQRRSSAAVRQAVHDIDVGEVSPYAVVTCANPPQPVALRAGDFFGIDTCINFYPRDLTVEAAEPCVVLEMLRSVLDSIRDAGDGGERVEHAYRQSAMRTQFYRHTMFRDLSAAEMDWLVSQSELLTPGSDAVTNDTLFGEGAEVDGIYLLRAGTIKLSQRRAGGDATLTYLGSGTLFGLEEMLPRQRAAQLRLVCVSHPQEVASVALGTSITVGRAQTCEVPLVGSRGVSRKHCRIEQRGDEMYLVDLGSLNGTLLNGELIQEVLLTTGDLIGVGDFTFRIDPVSIDPKQGPRARLTTASGLDSFEVIKISSATLRELGKSNTRFLATASSVAQAVDAAIQRPAAEQALVDEVVELNLYNSQNTLLIDLDRCTRCDQCVRACATAHDGVARFTRDGPRFGNYLVTLACRSCSDPKCMVGCPVGSIRRRESLEIHIEDWCIGCGRCANNCPFGNINMVELAASPAKSPEPQAPAWKATVCDLCAGYEGPSCVYACPHDAAIRVNPSRFLTIGDVK